MQAIEAVAAGKPPPVTLEGVSGPVAVDTVAAAGDWQEHWKHTDRARRERSPWSREK
jgi:hypothetical protein